MSEMEQLLELRNRVVSGVADAAERADFVDLAGELEHRPSVALVRLLADDPDEIVRYNALCSLVLKLGHRTADVHELCWRRLEEDPDGDVRRMALSCLSSIHFGDNDLTFFGRLEQILRSVDCPPDLLETAYQAMFEVVGLPPSEWPDPVARGTEPMKPDEIDWMKVAKLRAMAEAERKRQVRDHGQGGPDERDQ